MSGQQEVYVRRLTDDGDQVKVSIDGGSEPIWSKRGSELYYRAPSGAGAAVLMAASLRFEPELAVTDREELFDVSDVIPTSPHANYDVSPVGRTFAMVRQSPATRIVVLQNVPALVRELEQDTRR